MPPAGWKPWKNAPRDGRWFIAVCNDGVTLKRLSWGLDRQGHVGWCGADASYGDGLFEPNGGWADWPQAAPVGLFDGGAKADDRIKMVVRMLGYHEDEVQYEVMRHVAAELLSKAESVADKWLRNEISECLRGESARRVLKKYRAQR